MGNSESSNPIRNMDKRTARREYKEDFVRGIETYKRKLLAQQARSSPATQPPDSSQTGNIKVFVRKRPIFHHELAAGEFDVVTCSDFGVAVHDARMHSDMKRQLLHHHHFEFDHIFNEHMNNSVVYQKTARPLVDIACRGGFATAMVYGQTGSGKTFTMSSIYAAAAEDIFNTLHSDVERFSKPPSVSLSLVEIAGETVSDLLNGFALTQLRTAADGAVHAFPVTEPIVSSTQELLAVIQHGLNIRTTAATGVHDASSRSHAILRIYIRRYDLHPGEEAIEGTLTLVDLAGSEHRIDSMYHGKERRKETSQINSSLMALKECIRARAQGAGALRQHVFRKSKLTQALKTSFTLADAYTIVIATVSPASKDTEHSLNTLRHACIMHGQEGNRDEKRFVTGGETIVEQIGEVNTTGIARKNRAQKKVSGEIENIKTSNGNHLDNKVARAANQETELTEKMKRKLQRQSEAKSFNALPARIRELLKMHRSNLGDEAYQLARFRHTAGMEMYVEETEQGGLGGEVEEEEEYNDEEDEGDEGGGEGGEEVRDEVDHFHSSLKDDHAVDTDERSGSSRRPASAKAATAATAATAPAREISLASLYDCVFLVQHIVHPMALSIQLEALGRLHGKSPGEIAAFFAAKGLALPAAAAATATATATAAPPSLAPPSSARQDEGRPSPSMADSASAGTSRTPNHKVVAHISVRVPGLQPPPSRPASRPHPRQCEGAGGGGASAATAAVPLSARSLSAGSSSARPGSAEARKASDDSRDREEVSQARHQLEREAIQRKARQEAARAFRDEKAERVRQKADQRRGKPSTAASVPIPAPIPAVLPLDPPPLESVAATELGEIQRIQRLLEEDVQAGAEHRLSAAMKFGLKKQMALLRAAVLRKDRARQGRPQPGQVDEGGRGKEVDEGGRGKDVEVEVEAAVTAGDDAPARPASREVDYARLYEEDRWEAPGEGHASETQFSGLGRPLSVHTAHKLSQRKPAARLSYGRGAAGERQGRLEERPAPVDDLASGTGQARVQGTVIDYNHEYDTVAYGPRSSRSGGSGASGTSRYRLG